MIGTLRVVPESGFAVTAQLNDFGVWSSPDPEFGRFLNLFYSPRREGSPIFGVFGLATIRMAAQALNGTCDVNFQPSAVNEKRIY